MPDLWRVRLVATEPRLTAEGWLGDQVPTPTGGGGGHEVVKMPKRRPVIVWRGGDLYGMSFSIVFDAFVDDGQAVAPDYDDLLRMWRPADDEAEPPTLRIDCEGDAVPLQHLSWVMTGLDWGAAEGNRTGNRARQTFTVTLTEYNPDERLDFATQKTTPSAARRAKNKRKSGARSSVGSYTVKSGDTLSQIADRLKIRGGWRALAEAQKPPLTDPRSIRVGQVLRLP